MKKAAVTGGAGFIGSHLAESLVERGFQVVILDDLSSGTLTNVEGLLQRGNVEFVRGSILDMPLLAKVFSGVTYVFHQAAIPSVPRSIDNPLPSHEANSTGTLKVLLAARDCGVRQVIYASSSSVYGDTPTLPKREDMAPNPQSPYAAAKLAGESLVVPRCNFRDVAYIVWKCSMTCRFQPLKPEVESVTRFNASKEIASEQKRRDNLSKRASLPEYSPSSREPMTKSAFPSSSGFRIAPMSDGRCWPSASQKTMKSYP